MQGRTPYQVALQRDVHELKGDVKNILKWKHMVIGVGLTASALTGVAMIVLRQNIFG